MVNIKQLLKIMIPLSWRSKIKNIPKFFYYPCKVHMNKIVFINFDGRGFGDNPKYICLEMLHQNLKLDFVWPLKNMNETVPKNIRSVHMGSLKYLYELATAHMIIINVNNVLPSVLKKKKNQLIVQTWHGSHGFKYIERQADDTLSESYTWASKKSIAMTNIFISDGPENTQMYRDAFQCTCPIIETGMPREDILFSQNQQYFDKIRKSLGIGKKKSVLLYAPTFRDDGSIDAYNLDLSKTLEALTRRFTGNWIVLVRLHPNVKNGVITYNDKNIIDISSYGDVQEIISISDVLITDYSSIYHDFFIIDKPVFLYTSDLDAYIRKNRYLKPMFFKMKWKRNKDIDELIDDIMNFDEEKYKKITAEYKKQIGAIIDGRAAYRVVEYLKQYL